ncbi:MAG: hypothetical protein HYV60_05190 [Planctomycetia bacterium]|nr:hypothetical protein [Planctomycetia bacterium]
MLLARPGHAERFERARAEVMRLNQDGRSGDIQLESVTKLLIGQQLSVFRRASTGLWQYADRCTVRAIAAPSVTVEYEQTKPLLEDLIIDWPLVDASGTERGQVYPFAEDAISLAAMLQAFRSGRSSERTAQWSLLESDRLLAQYLKVSELRANSTRLAALSADLRRQSEALAKLEQAVQKAQQDVVTLTQEEAQAKKRLQEHADRLLKAREQVQMVEEKIKKKYYYCRPCCLDRSRYPQTNRRCGAVTITATCPRSFNVVRRLFVSIGRHWRTLCASAMTLNNARWFTFNGEKCCCPCIAGRAPIRSLRQPDNSCSTQRTVRATFFRRSRPSVRCSRLIVSHFL